MLPYMRQFKDLDEPEGLAEVLKPVASPYTVKAMLGKTIRYRLPLSGGQWIYLTGTVVNVTGHSILVREKYLEGESTINPEWFVCYLWGETKTPTSKLVRV